MNPVTRPPIKFDHLALVGIAFRELTHEALRVLDDVKIPSATQTLTNLEDNLENPIVEFAYIEKCNAVLLLAVFQELPDQAFLDDFVKAWQKLSGHHFVQHKSHIISLRGLDALIYLFETSIGLHSVVIGDSQVYSQVRDPIRVGAKASSKSVFREIMWLMRRVRSDIQTKTQLHRGFTSLERLACLLIDQELKRNESVAVVGLGNSGRLVTKILKKEQKREVFVTARSSDAIEAVFLRYGGKQSQFMPQGYLQSIAGLVLALENNEETRAYADYLKGQIEKTSAIRIVVDLSSPPLLTFPVKVPRFSDITTLSEMAQKVVRDRSKDIEVAKRFIRDLLGKLT
jgi:glutamyl-tRNA reductase